MNVSIKFVVGVIATIGTSVAIAVNGNPITRQLQPYQIVVSGDTSLRGLNVYTSDVSAAGSANKYTTSVAYSLRSYPAQGGVESAELCYSTPYSSVISNCQKVVPGSSGSTTAFNALKFGAGATVWIRHKIVGGSFPATAPGSADVLTVNWRY